MSTAVLVTGAGRGIGREIALRFAAEGARVGLAGRTRATLEEVAHSCGPDAFVIPCDVSDERACLEAVRSCEDHFGQLDVLINNAGAAESRPFLSSDTAFWRRMMSVDVEGPMWLTQAALPGMLERNQGAVISIASIASKVGFAYVSAYVAAKHALMGLTRALAVEYAMSGVTFNCICPYYVDTPMTQATITNIVAKTGRSEEHARKALLSPQGRLITPGEVADVCLLLASPAGRSVNGQGWNIDGGACQT